jgi:ribosome-associated protein
MNEAEKIVKYVINALDDRKGVAIVKIDLRKIENCFCSFFVVCHGTSSTHVAGLADYACDLVLEKTGEKPLHTEGENQAQWILLDYGDVVVHVFQKEQRDYYQLEDFWVDAKITEIAENITTHV